MSSNRTPLNVFGPKLFRPIFFFLIALIPIFRMGWFLASNGSGNLSNDEIILVPFVDQVLNGTYPWRNFLWDSFQNGHWLALPYLIQVALAYFFHWQVSIALGLGFFFSVLQLFLVFDLLAFRLSSPYRWFLLPILAFLIFSPSQLSVFEFGFLTLNHGMGDFFFLLGLWALFRISNGWTRAVLMLLGGSCASLISGSVPLIWLIYGMAIVLMPPYDKRLVLGWLLGGLLFSGAFLYLLFQPPHFDWYSLVEVRGNKSPFTPQTFPNLRFLIEALGWPFAQGFSHEQAYHRGKWAWAFILPLIYLGRVGRNGFLKNIFLPSFLLITYGFSKLILISLVRVQLAPWYTKTVLWIWVGILGLLIGFLLENSGKSLNASKGSQFLFLMARGGSILMLAFVYYFYLTSNISFADKSYYLQARSPASESCLRNYKTAPTYCEQRLFLWPSGQYQLMAMMAEPLERRSLNAFAPKQKWTLQGDFILENVHIHETAGIPDIFWSADLKATPTPFSDYKHLNLFLHTPNSIDWTIVLPSHLKKADFHSAIAISESAPFDPQSDGVTFEVIAQPEGGDRKVLFSRYIPSTERAWKDFSVPLTQFAGQKLTLRLSSQMGKNVIHDWAMYRYPYIDLELDETKVHPSEVLAEVHPSNTDLSPEMPKPTLNDFIFDFSKPELWRVSEMEPLKQDVWRIGQHPSVRWENSLGVCLSGYSHFYMKLAASPNIYPRAARVFFQIDGNPGYQKNFWIPLLADGQLHQYTYDLKLLELKPKTHLTGIRLDPIENGRKLENVEIQISDLRLIRSDKVSGCD